MKKIVLAATLGLVAFMNSTGGHARSSVSVSHRSLNAPYDDFVSRRYSDYIEASDGIFTGTVENIQTSYGKFSLTTACFVTFKVSEWIKRNQFVMDSPLQTDLLASVRVFYQAAPEGDYENPDNCPMQVGQKYLVFGDIDRSASPDTKFLRVDFSDTQTVLMEYGGAYKASAIKEYLSYDKRK